MSTPTTPTHHTHYTTPTPTTPTTVARWRVLLSVAVVVCLAVALVVCLVVGSGSGSACPRGSTARYVTTPTPDGRGGYDGRVDLFCD